MKLTHRFLEMTPEKRPQYPYLDGTGLRFETMEHGGEYPDTMPQAIEPVDAEGRSCIYVPITQDSKVVDIQGFTFEQSRGSVVLDREHGEASAMMIDPEAKLLAVLDHAETYRGLAIRAKDRGERESYERIVELYVEIAEELEALIDGWASP